MKTIAQQLNIKSFPFEIHVNGKLVYYETSNENWHKSEYDANGNEVYYENSHGDWCKREYDANGKEVYFEDSNGYIRDNRPKPVKEFTMDEIAKVMGIPVEQLKIKK
jgi:hypothetical protein